MSSHKAGVAGLWKVCKVVAGTHGSAQHAVLVITIATHQICGSSDTDRRLEGGAREKSACLVSTPRKRKHNDKPLKMPP